MSSFSDQNTTMDTVPKKRKRRLLTFAAVLVLSLLAWYFYPGYQSPLTPEEQLLVGHWSEKASPMLRIFNADRTATTIPPYYHGVWRIEEGTLYVTVWENAKFPKSLSSLGTSWNSLQRSFIKEDHELQIEFNDTGDQCSLNHRVDPQHPDGKWHWLRKPTK